MGFWTKLIAAAIPAVVDYFGGGDDTEKEDKDKTNLVKKPTPGTLDKEQRKLWSPTARYSDFDSRMPGAVGATPALKNVNPSELSSRYWAAIYDDAKRRSEI
jgi:hypothetical protein